jgi:ribonuclease P/MRP protein subunit RPP40
LYYLDECSKITANGGVVDSIYLDFSKAFDTVPHKRLLGKLDAYGIQGDLFNWIKAFLSNRSQEVVVNGSKSSSAQVISGVPQGSVLGPVLFVIYINDILDNIKSAGLMFADDTKIYRHITSRDDAIELQSDIEKLEEWSKTWLLHFNHEKCHVLTMGKFTNIQYAHRYAVYNNDIEHVFDEKDLGITVDSELKFEEHLAKKVKIANAIVGQMRRSFSYLDCDTFRRIFTAFARPHLEYGEAVWSPHLVRNINALENVQIRATKLVDGLSKLDYPERLKRLNLPTLVFRRRRGDIIEMYKHFHNYDKVTLAPSFQPRSRLSRQHRFQLHTPQAKDGETGFQANFFFQRTTKVWNELPRYVVEAIDVDEFKQRLDETWENNPMKFDHKATEA